MINALKLVGKRMEAVTAVINGAGAAGTAIALRLRALGVGEVILCDRAGILCEGMEGLSPAHARMAALTNRGRRTGTLADALRGADVFIGVSGPKLVTAEMVSAMAKDAAVFAMANPVPKFIGISDALEWVS